jgi:hypothetical protein
MKRKLVLPLLALLLVAGTSVCAETIRVQASEWSIQEAIAAAEHGDTVLVGPGIYYENINFMGKLITVRSEEGPLRTEIVGWIRYDPAAPWLPDALVTFESGETTDAVFEGFTLRGGWIGIRCVNSAATIRRNILVGQRVTDWAAICLSGPGYPEWATIGWAPAVIENNTIIFCENGGISTFSTEPPVIKNNIIAFNKHYGIHRQSPNDSITAHPDLSYNDVYGHIINYYNIAHPGTGTIHADPQLTRSYTLGPYSPCIDAGDPDPAYNDPDGSRNDMGAVPFTGDDDDVVIPTNEWISIYCSVPIMPPIAPGQIPANSVIRAYDPDGVLCGIGKTHSDGTYDYIPIYRDDIYTDRDEGAEPGDVISLTINGEPVNLYPPLVWTQHGETFEICSYAHERCMRIQLHRGWNLISWNVEYMGPLEELIAGIEECVDVVLSWSFDTPGVYDPRLESFSTIDYVYYTQGYWFRMNCDAVLEVCGPEILSICLDDPGFRNPWIILYPGWNIVSYWPRFQLSVENGFHSILPVLEGADGFKNGALIWRPDTPYQNTLNHLDPGYGYLVNVSEMATLIYPGFECDSIHFFGDGAFAYSGGIPSKHWISLYGEGITLDGSTLQPGDIIEARTEEGTTCGSAWYENGILRFTPVYGYDDLTPGGTALPTSGEMVNIYVNGVRTYPDIEWSEHGARVELDALFSNEEDVTPNAVALSQNYPNPFNPGTTIKFELPADCTVRLTIYNAGGQRVKTLVDRHFTAGRYEEYWDGTNDLGQRVSSGIYFYRLETPDQTETKKMVMLQ